MGGQQDNCRGVYRDAAAKRPAQNAFCRMLARSRREREGKISNTAFSFLHCGTALCWQAQRRYASPRSSEAATARATTPHAASQHTQEPSHVKIKNCGMIQNPSTPRPRRGSPPPSGRAAGQLPLRLLGCRAKTPRAKRILPNAGPLPQGAGRKNSDTAFSFSY